MKISILCFGLRVLDFFFFLFLSKEFGKKPFPASSSVVFIYLTVTTNFFFLGGGGLFTYRVCVCR